MHDSFEKQLRYFNLGEDYFWLSAHYDACLLMATPYLKKLQEKRGANELKILDAGCGPGNFISRIQHRGITFGTDFSIDALRFCSSKHHAPTFRSSLEHIPIQSDSLDCIVALETLEHIEKDCHVLREFYRVLEPGGIALISVPAFMSLWGDHDEMYGHFRRYSRRELTEKIKQAGFTIYECQYFKCIFFIPLFLLRKLKRFFSSNTKKKHDDFYSVRPFLNRFLKWLIVHEMKWKISSKMPFGTTLLCVFCKSSHEA